MINKYRGRFAPSPTGPLHFGSLVAALGSWLDAKANKGLWFVRMEDIDPPREMLGAQKSILRTLEDFGLEWDGEVVYQSKQLRHYHELLKRLKLRNLTYYCQCTRKQIKQNGGIYRNLCREKNIIPQDLQSTHQQTTEHFSIRLKVQDPIVEFNDGFQGKIRLTEDTSGEDFILKRKDGLFAYMLAVVADDIEQNITQVVRGYDLIDTTHQQIYLHHLLTESAPSYSHLPIIVDKTQKKLSKQHHAAAVSSDDIEHTLVQALIVLHQNPPSDLANECRDDLLQWAILNWKPEAFYGITQIVL